MEFEEQFLLNERVIKQESLEDEHSELIIPKQEAEESLENVKEEPIEEKFTEQTMTKLENVSEQYNYSVMSNNPIQKSVIVPQEDFPKLDVQPPRKVLKRFRCSVCLQMQIFKSIKYVTMEEDKLITMVGCVLRGDYSLDQAQSLMYKNRVLYICYTHFSKAINRIYIVLNIKNSDEITSCSSEMMDNLMVTVNALNPQIETEQFCDIVDNFIRRNILQKRRQPCAKGEGNNKPQNHHCSVCTQRQCSKYMKCVSMQDEKFVIMVGCVLHGEYTLEHAKTIISQMKVSYICHVHFSEALTGIYKALTIKQSDEVPSCSTELWTNLMNTVNKLCPSIMTSNRFCFLFNQFITRNRKFLGGMITLTRMDCEEQKPKDVLLNEREIKQETNSFIENVKEEPIEEEYLDRIVPKREEVMKSSTLYLPQAINLLNPALKFKIQMQSADPKLNVKPEGNQEELHVESKNNNKNVFDLQHRRCSVCLQINPRQNMKQVTTEEDKLVIMVACLLRGDHSLDRAQLFMSGKGTVCICYDHFYASLDEIHNVLNIKNSDEITSCSSDLVDNLMVTVNTLDAQIENAQFCDIIYKFERRNISRKRKHPNPEGEQNEKQLSYHCSVCSQTENSNIMKQVTLQDEKLVIMIGCILCGEYTLKQAHSFISQKNFPLVCHIHFSGALNEIYKAVNIKHPDEVSSWSVELLANLMIVVNELCPLLQPCQLETSLNKFFMRNKHFIQLLSDL